VRTPAAGATGRTDDAGKGRKRREGVAIVYDTSQPVPSVMHRVLLQGDGYGVAAGESGPVLEALDSNYAKWPGGNLPDGKTYGAAPFDHISWVWK